jgi:hypothetical protein
VANLAGRLQKNFDYNKRTGSNEDYFRMGAKRRKELGLPGNFCITQYRDMERFLSQWPCLNPPHQRDTLDDNNHVFIIPDQLHSYCAANNINLEDLGDDNFTGDPTLEQSALAANPAWTANPVLSQRPPLVKGKDKVESSTFGMKLDSRPPNTAIWQRHSSS